MAQRILILCRSNHDPIEIGHLACRTLLGRPYSSKVDYIRWAGEFDDLKAGRKCQVLVDCNVSERDSSRKVPLTGYSVTDSGDEMLEAYFSLDNDEDN